MLGNFIVNKVWSDGFCEHYAMVEWGEKKVELGVYFLCSEDVGIGDILSGELVIDCAKITAPMHLNENIEFSAHFEPIQDTDVRADVVIKSIENKNTLYGYINSDFSDIKIDLIEEIPNEGLSCGDEIAVKGLLTLELV